jgi:hypothetical protein
MVANGLPPPTSRNSWPDAPLATAVTAVPSATFAMPWSVSVPSVAVVTVQLPCAVSKLKFAPARVSL